MATKAANFTIHYPDWYDENAVWEVANKGWLEGVTVELPGGLRYPVFFHDSIRLGQDLEADAREGKPFVAEPGLIVLPEVTRPAIQRAVGQLIRDGYFSHLRPSAAPLQNMT